MSRIEMIATNPEQSERLIACGVDPKSADMYWSNSKGVLCIGDIPHDFITEEADDDEDVPAWSTGALFNLLPAGVYKKRVLCNFSMCVNSNGDWRIFYTGLVDWERPLVDCVESENPSLIETLVTVIENLLKQGYSLNYED